MSKMINCKTCNAESATSAKVCPKCGAKNKKPSYKRVWIWFLVAIVLIAVISGTGGDSNVDTNVTNPSTNVSTDVDNAPTNTPSEEMKTPATEIEPVEKLTVGQKNAIRKAESYIDIMAFSAKGLIKQLEFEGFSSEDASFAVNNIEVDWNEQAALKAKDYLDMMGFSADGLADQLEFEGFTEEQISYALKAVGY